MTLWLFITHTHVKNTGKSLDMFLQTFTLLHVYINISICVHVHESLLLLSVSRYIFRSGFSLMSSIDFCCYSCRFMFIITLCLFLKILHPHCICLRCYSVTIIKLCSAVHKMQFWFYVQNYFHIYSFSDFLFFF